MATALVRPELLYAWNGPSLLIVNTRGECGADQSLSGFYFREARFLRTLRLEINGELPWLCEAAAIDPRSIALTFVHPEITQPGGGGSGQAGDEEGTDARGLPERSLDFRLSYDVGVAGLTILLIVTNRAPRRLQFDVAWELSADYADIQEAQSGRREQEAAVDVNAGDSHVEFAYRHAQLPFRTEVHHDRRWTLRGHRAVCTLSLEPQETTNLSLRVVPFTGRHDITADDARARDSAAGLATTIRAR